MKKNRKVRTGVLMASASLGLAMVALTGPAAQAAAPANDAWTDATAIAGLPFHAKGSTVEATTDTVRPPGAYRADSHSMWWKITVPKDTRLYVATAPTTFNMRVGLYDAENATTTPDLWTQVGHYVNWRDRAGMVRAIEGGETYYLMVSSYGNNAGGDFQMVVRHPAKVGVTLAKTGFFDKVDGSAVFHGSVKSDRPTTVVRVSGYLRQLVGRHVTSGWGQANKKATATWSLWKVRVSTGSSFKAGAARLSHASARIFDNGVFVKRIQFPRTVITLK